MAFVRFLKIIAIAAPLLIADAKAKEAGIFHPKTFTLQNGLQVVVITNARAPVVTQMLWYKVGSIDDPQGKSGLAHFLEHLMFKGTPQVPGDAFMEAITKIGGEQNAFTTSEYTCYYQKVSAAHLELAIRLEADRMAGLSLLPGPVKNESKVILEERRTRIDSDPGAILAEAANKAFYWHHPYGIPVIGWEHEMTSLTREDAKKFYKTWYIPNNAVLIFAGDVTVEKVKPLVEKYYGKVPQGKTPTRTHAQEPAHRGVLERVSLSSPYVDYPQWNRRYPAPNYKDDNDSYPYALDILSDILSNGATSLLYKNLVESKKMAAWVSAGYSPANFGPASFTVGAQPSQGHTPEEIEAAFEQEIAQLLKNGISKDDVEKAKRRKLVGISYLKDNVFGGAEELGMTLVTGRTIDDVESWPKKINAVTVRDVNAVLKLVFEAKDHVTTLLLPKNTPTHPAQSQGTNTK